MQMVKITEEEKQQISELVFRITAALGKTAFGFKKELNTYDKHLKILIMENFYSQFIANFVIENIRKEDQHNFIDYFGGLVKSFVTKEPIYTKDLRHVEH